MITQIKIYIAIAVVVALLGLGIYIKYLQSENKTLTESNAKLTLAVSTQKETILSMEADSKKARIAQTNLFEDYSNSRKENSRLTKILSKHDLKYLALRKPGLIENRVNKAQVKIDNCLTKLSKGETC